ncbi:MAG: AI-2E family transporter [Acidobacteriota bacterium]|nr:AI-2E family transporter [Acidobacteriota bacterium]MDE3139345.1 AI-2E family transporter [Acidobacteriota bacterium]MDE3147000.1 AI-2E family transporter [Acidobacteriota bacterium]
MMSTAPSDRPDGTPASPDTRRARLIQRAARNNVPLNTILTTIAVIVAVYFAGKLLYRLRDLMMLLVVGGFIALILNPAVIRLQKIGVRRRGIAVLIVSVASAVVFLLLALAFGYPLVNGLTHLANNLPTYVNNAEHGKGWIGHLIARYHITTWVDANSAKIVSFARGLSKPALALGKGAISMLMTLLTLFIFVILLLLNGPKIRNIILISLAPERARRAEEIGALISRAALGYVVGNLVMSLAAGVVVFVTLWLTGVPFALLFALWVVLVDFLPQVGGALAGIPTVLFAFVQSTSAGVVTLIVFVVYTLVQNHVLYPIVMSRAIKLNALLVFLAILIGAQMGDWVGGTFGGLVGVILAIPMAAALHVIVSQWWESSRPVDHGPPEA